MTRRAFLLAVLAAASATAADTPRRIISLVPATTEILFAIGAGPRVIGVGSYDRYPPEATKRPKMGGLLDPNVERVLASKPDLVVAFETQVELKRELERARIPTYLYIDEGLADVTRTIRELGRRVGADDAAQTLATDVESQLAATRTRVAGSGRPRTLLVLGRDPGSLRNVYASGGVGFLHDLLEIAGARDVMADVKRKSVQLTTEMILARAPDVIIELHYGTSLRPERMDAERRVWNQLSSVPAVSRGRVYLLAGDEFVVPGPRVVLAADRFARTLHPDMFVR